MFNVSFNELFIVAIFIVLLLKPKDFPFIIQKCKGAFAQVLDIKDEILKQTTSVKDEIEEIKQDVVKELSPDEQQK